jgi:predicted nuclease with TOPRIM domain
MANADKINEMIEESQYMSSMVRKLKDAKGSIDNRFEDMESEIDRLVSTMKDLQSKLEMVEKEMVKKKAPPKPKTAEISYQIQAVVEGRAWLEDNNGRTLTIKVGDIVPQYGVVTKIDAVNSLVFTSSGKTIRVNN